MLDITDRRSCFNDFILASDLEAVQAVITNTRKQNALDNGSVEVVNDTERQVKTN